MTKVSVEFETSGISHEAVGITAELVGHLVLKATELGLTDVCIDGYRLDAWGPVVRIRYKGAGCSGKTADRDTFAEAMGIFASVWNEGANDSGGSV